MTALQMASLPAIAAGRALAARRAIPRLLMLLMLLQAALASAAAGPGPAVATAHPLATQAGLDMLRRGGNSFDAAVAISATLAVVEPYSSGLGGGGFWLLYRAKDGLQIMVDGRETAPGAASRDMYLDGNGEVKAKASIDGPLAAGIPGTVAALAHIASRYGVLSLPVTLAPAIRAARRGFKVSPHYQRLAAFRQAALQTSQARRIFLDQGKVPGLNTLIKQPELAETLRLIAAGGAKAFYRGEIARRLVNSVRRHGGIWRMRDLAAYRVVERNPIRGTYKDIHIVSASPPSSGGIVLLQALNILERYDLDSYADTGRKHLTIEAMRRAYHDRAVFLGDPDFVAIPPQLADKHYARRKSGNLQIGKATPSAALGAIAQSRREGADTTHFSVLDNAGNLAAATLSINYPFGSGFVAEGTGVLLNDEMDDFSIKPMTPNAYGLTGGQANAIAPGKRPLSSMTPTFLFGKDRTAILGTPGGSRIISMVLLAVLDFARGNDAASMTALPRYHHQYEPDVVQFEPGALAETQQRELRAMGHELHATDRRYGNMQTILWHRRSHRVEAASDPRAEGTARVLGGDGPEPGLRILPTSPKLEMRAND